MKNPKVFLFIVAVISFILFFFVFPVPIKIGGFAFNPSKLDLNIGSFAFKRELSYRLGLDLSGGTRLTYQVDMSGIKREEQQAAFESIRNVIDRRINFFGVTEPTIQTLKLGNDYRIIVELPGVTNVKEATELIGKTAQLTFWEDVATAINNATSPGTLPPGITVFLKNPSKTALTGKHLNSAKVAFDKTSGGAQVQLSFTDEGKKLFADITKRNVNKPLAIVLDNQLVGQPPRVNEPILDGNAVITGNFTSESAKALAIQLNAGALPAPLKLIAESTVGATLGSTSLKKSLFAGLIGFISVVLFMSYLYKKEGILASGALVIYTVIVLFIFKLFAVTLTLAGIAGFILSVGMAVDANILIFERMREELRLGKPRDIAIRLGFLRAWSSIRDSNISSLITSFILYYFGSGIVRGFAITLAIGILVSMFSAIVVTRSLLFVFDKGNNSSRLVRS